MPTIVVKEDNLNELNKNYVQSRLLAPIFLNSVPKCGTHLVRNVMRMFVPVEQQYHAAFIQHAVLRQHQVAFSQIAPHLSWGHLLFSDDAAVLLRHTHKIVQIRDPYDWVLARARFFLSDSFQGSLEHLKGGNATIDEVINMMIFGIHGKAPSLNDIFTHNASPASCVIVDWMDYRTTGENASALVQTAIRAARPGKTLRVVATWSYPKSCQSTIRLS
jgi:hypothetical protein